jgi:ribokinase
MPLFPRPLYVVGSINQDVVLGCDRVPAAGETRVGGDLRFLPGGKGANQAVAARRYLAPDQPSASVTLLGQVGADAFGRSMVDYLRSQGLELEVLVDAKAATGTALILVEASGDNRIVLHPGANGTLRLDKFRALHRLQPGDLLLLQNEIDWTATVAALTLGRQRGSLNLLNPAPARELSAEVLSMVDVLVVNEHEYATVLGESLDADESLDRLQPLVERQRAFLPCDLLVTLGERGAILTCADQAWSVSGHSVRAVDTTGAGDCFVGAFAAGLAGGMTHPMALDFANRAAAISVTRAGASVSFPTLAEVRNAMG